MKIARLLVSAQLIISPQKCWCQPSKTLIRETIHCLRPLPLHYSKGHIISAVARKLYSSQKCPRDISIHSWLQNCSTNLNSRRRRSADNMQDTTVTDVATVSSGPIITRRDNGEKLNGLHMLTSQHSGTLQQLQHQNIEGTVTHSLYNTYFTSVVVG